MPKHAVKSTLNIAFVEPKPAVNLSFSLNRLPLLGPLYLGTLLKSAGHEVGILNESMVRAYNEKTDQLHPCIEAADVVGITSVTHSANRAYQIADSIRRHFPAKRIIMGGSHASALPEEALEHVDQVVVGEGENVVLDVFEGTNREPRVHGTRVNMDELPPLDLDLLRGYRNRKGDFRLKLGPLMASRGCPHDCTFCSVTRMFGRRYRIKDPDLVMEEIMMRYREGFRRLFFYDDNFAANPEKAKILLEKLIRADLDLVWSSQFSVHVARDRELVTLLKRSRCSRILIGVESINPEALKEYRKSQTVAMIKESINTLVSEDLTVHSMFIIGAESATAESIEKTVRFSVASKTRTSQFSILFPIPGTELYRRVLEQDRIFIEDWNYYDGTHSVFLLNNLNPLELQKQFFKSYRIFYSKKFITWVLSRVGFLIWKFTYRKYMRYIRYIARKLKRYGIHRETFAHIKNFILENAPRSHSLTVQRSKEPAR
jgi:anaerobic magnesium-protoporphyrin IX monomethyl ester cyclase